MLKMISYVHFGLLLLILVASWLSFRSESITLSAGLGGLTVGLNLFVLAFAWGKILDKKLIALSVLIIVSKYTILAAMIIYSMRQSWFDPVGFGAGVASLMITLLVSSFFPKV
jgi:hypothetical protein